MAAKKGGCGFAQEIMIHNGRIVSHTCPDDNVNEFRALCLTTSGNHYLFIDEEYGLTAAATIDLAKKELILIHGIIND